MKLTQILSVFGLATALAGAFPAVRADVIRGRVVGVLDGDTITLLDSQNRQYRVRLAEIDAPEKTQAFGQQSKQSLSDLAFRKTATADCPSQDRYGRSICLITVDGVNVNLAQVQRGMAWAYTQYAKDARIFAAEREARKARLGLWTDSNPTPPWLFRRNKD